jgi:hypothetical protein
MSFFASACFERKLQSSKGRLAAILNQNYLLYILLESPHSKARKGKANTWNDGGLVYLPRQYRQYIPPPRISPPPLRSKSGGA